MRLSDKIRHHAARVAVIGQGYVGLPLAIEFAKVGFRVVGVDLDEEKVASLNRGDSYIPDVESRTIRHLREDGGYRATTDMGVLADSDAIVICVPTPLRKSKDPDISFVLAASTEVKKHLHPGVLVILESTTYPGTTKEVLLPMFEDGGLKVGREFFLAFSPERIDPGNTQFTVKDIPKVVGGITAACSRMAALLYGQIVSRVQEVSSPMVAELAKLYENTFRSVNIALADDINRRMPRYVVELLSEGLNNREKCLNGATILILGVAYKRGVGDVRESPALDVITELQRKGARVHYADPFVSSLAREGLEVRREEVTAEVLGACDAVVILTDHREFDYQLIVEQADLIIDARNATRGMTVPENKVIRL